MRHQDKERARTGYHHGNLREALVQAALGLIAERGLAGFAIAELARAVGVSSAAPYRHFRDRDAVLAEVARRGFEGLAAELGRVLEAHQDNPVLALERCAQAHLAFAGREAAVYGTMFEANLPDQAYPELSRARSDAFAVIRRAAQMACEASQSRQRPPPVMVALHVWSITHGIAVLFVRDATANRGMLPMHPEELLEAGLLVYLRALELPAPK